MNPAPTPSGTPPAHSAATPSPRRHRRHANPFALRHPVAAFDPAAHFGRQAPLALDIGCGPGRFVAELAQARPHMNVLGLEIRAHLVEATLAAVAAAQAQATLAGGPKLYGHALVANANLHLAELLQDNSVAFVSVNFPDPWYKKRHHKRRVLTTEFLQVLLPKLQDGAEIHAMSDYAPIAQAMREALADDPRLTDLHTPDAWCTHSTTGLTTEREQTHLARGEPIWRMAYRFHRGG